MAADLPGLHEQFEARAAETPRAIAVSCVDRQISFDHLNRRANQIGRYLRRRAHVEDRIGLCAGRSSTLIAAALGILKAGCAYVPIDPRWPAARAIEALAAARVSMLITDLAQAEHPHAFDGRRLALDSGAEPRIDDESDANLLPVATAGNLACIVFTSGSTGMPKAVAITGEMLVRRLSSMQTTFDFRPGDKALLHRPPTIVAFPRDCFGPLLCGVPVVVASDADARDAARLLTLAIAQGVTHMSATPTLWRAILDEAVHHPKRWTTLRIARTGGEPLTAELACRWAAVFPTVALWNVYGCTECSAAAAGEVTTANVEAQRVPIGSPSAAVQVLLLDDDLRPTPREGEGEVYLGGPTIARGYFGQPSSTAERFVANPFAERPGERMFRTGDLGRRRTDGGIEIVGRADRQAKVRGYRVELREVEEALLACPGVLDVSVACERLRADAPSELVAYVRSSIGDGSSLAVRLRASLSTVLPEFMIPSRFVAVGPGGPPNACRQTGVIPPPAIDATTTVPGGATTDVEALIHQLWIDVLGIPHAESDDNFFDIGGNSILAMQLLVRVYDALSVRIALDVFFEHPTIAGLATVLQAGAAEP